MLTANEIRFSTVEYVHSICIRREREGCPLRCLHWKIACLPCNTIWLIDCVSFPKSQTLCSQMSKRKWHEINFPTITTTKSQKVLDIGQCAK